LDAKLGSREYNSVPLNGSPQDETFDVRDVQRKLPRRQNMISRQDLVGGTSMTGMRGELTQVTGHPVRAALVGVGAWGRVLAKAAAKSSAIDFVCCVGRNTERLATFAKEFEITACDIASVLANKHIDAVVLAIPNERHLEFAELAAQAGKHVFIEKPIANTMADGLRVAKLERAYGVRIVVGHCARLLAGNRLIREAIDNGDLGHVSQIEANFSNDRALKLSPQDWRWYRTNSPGGSLSQIAIHQFDTLRFLGGDIVAVNASAARHSPVGAEVEDQWIVGVHFADGKLGTVISSWTSPGSYSVRVTGEAALMFYEIDQNHWAQPERLHENASLYLQRRSAGPAQRQHIAVPQGEMFRDELELFAAAVNGRECELSAANACQALAAVYAAIDSAAQGGREVLLADIITAADVDGAGRRKSAYGGTTRGGKHRGRADRSP
jgi:predicted dehydrogenase